MSKFDRPFAGTWKRTMTLPLAAGESMADLHRLSVEAMIRDVCGFIEPEVPAPVRHKRNRPRRRLKGIWHDTTG